MRLHFDHTGLLSEMVGETHGLTVAEIDAGRPRAMEALQSFKRASEAHTCGFPHLPFQSAVFKEIRAYSDEVRGSYDTVCVVGIGGSALGAWAIDCALRGPHPLQGRWSSKFPRLVILDNVDPSFITGALDSMNPGKTLVLAIAKSGATAETAATFLIVKDWLERKLGRKAAARIVAVTSEKRGDLKLLATRQQYRTFHIPENVGGRFSVLSPVGLLPAALTGIDIRKLAAGAAEMTRACWKPDLNENIALRAALLHYLVWTRKSKSIQVAFPYSNRLWGTAFWFRQLWAESLGKARARSGLTLNTGQTPVAALGTTDQHSQVQLYMEGPNDKVYTFWTLSKYSDAARIPKTKLDLDAFDYLAGQSLAKLIDAERRSTAAALTAQQRPNCTITLERLDEAHLGAFLQMMQFQTAFAGELLDVNAFDQEGVELGKRFTFGLMGRAGFETFDDQFNRYERRRCAIITGGSLS
jgi:glucose-6-phosphate isomerase